VPALIGLVMRSRMPESPRWLLRHGKYDEVRKAMATLGVQGVSEDDARRAAEVVERVEGGSRESRRRAWTPGVRRALVVVSVFFIFQQITGINVPLYYGPHLLGPIFAKRARLAGRHHRGRVEVTLIMTAVNVAPPTWSSAGSTSTAETARHRRLHRDDRLRAGRGAGPGALSGTLRLVVIMIGLNFFIASCAVGVGGTGWTLQGEVFPTAVRGQAAAFCAMIDWLANFLIIEIFPVSQNALSLGGVMVIFAGLCALAIVFVWKFLPETKELPVEEIVRVFEKQQEQSVLHKVATS
jgi:hypothetical protein